MLPLPGIEPTLNYPGYGGKNQGCSDGQVPLQCVPWGQTLPAYFTCSKYAVGGHTQTPARGATDTNKTNSVALSPRANYTD
jgi:hypothetical protein